MTNFMNLTLPPLPQPIPTSLPCEHQKCMVPYMFGVIFFSLSQRITSLLSERKKQNFKIKCCLKALKSHKIVDRVSK